MGEYTEYINNLKAKYYNSCVRENIDSPKVSVIFQVFNSESKIERCVSSLLNQTLKDIEIIIIDQGSTDYTPLIIYTFRDLDKRIKVITAENDYDLNKIKKEALGEFVLVADINKKFDKKYIERFYYKNLQKSDNKSFSKRLFAYRDLDSHYIFKIFGIRISVRHKTNFYCPPATCSGTTENKRTSQLIVSLTSYPPRIKTTAIAINTLLHQKVKPDRVILWLADSQFPQKEKELPPELLNLTKYGLEIKWCKDLGSYKKIVPALKEFPEDIIVTADDDIYYQEDWLESLYNAYLENPQNIYVKRAVKMHVDNGEIKAFTSDVQEKLDVLPASFSNQLMSGSGCLFPPHSLHEDILDINNFLLLLPTHDDIYLWAMAILKGTKIKVVDGFKAQMETIDGTNLSALCKRNAENNGGIRADEALKRICKRYSVILTKLKSEEKISVVIPTLQINKNIFINLLSSLDKDLSVSEIIVIDNSCKGVEYNSPKLKVIIPDKNLFVNKSWNLGVNVAMEDRVALLNDDITIPENLCSSIVDVMTPDKGIIGWNVDYVDVREGVLPPPANTNITLEKITKRCNHFGIAMFFFKSSYYKIPDSLKIYYGDDWLIEQNNKTCHPNYSIRGQKIYHFESLTCKSKEFSPYSAMDTKEYEKLTKKWWHSIFYISNVYRGIKIVLLGIKFSVHYNKKH